MKAGESETSTEEMRALSSAKQAIARGRLPEVAGCYQRAARARERAGEDPLPHYLQALEFWAAGGRADRGAALARRLIKRRDGVFRTQRPLLRLRLAQLLAQQRKHAEAKAEFRLAFESFSRKNPKILQAGIGLAGSYLRLGELEPLPKLLHQIASQARKAEDRYSEASAVFLQALTAHWSGEWFEALDRYERALQLVEQRGMRSLAFSCCAGMSEIYLHLGMPQDAQDYASRAHALTRHLHDPDIAAEGALLLATALTAQALDLEESEAPGLAVGLRREARRLLATARKQFNRSRNHTRLSECWLEEQRLAFRSTPRTARHAATVAVRHTRASALESRLYLSRALQLKSLGHSTPTAAWRQLAQAAERSGVSEIAGLAWLSAAEGQPSGDPSARAARSSRAALERAANWQLRPRPGMASLPLHGWPGSARDATWQLALLAAAEGPEPKESCLEWALGAISRSSAPALGVPTSQRHERTGQLRAHYSALEAARLDDARRIGRWQPRAGQRTALRQARNNYFRSLDQPSHPVSAPALPLLEEPEALIVFAGLQEEIHCWVVRAPRRVVAHMRTLTVPDWNDAAELVDRQVSDARGWPDSIIPETLTRSAISSLQDIGTRIWTPLWPALGGAARIVIATDPTLPLLPFAALVLTAQPKMWPRPRAVTMVPDTRQKRPGKWQVPTGRAYAVATRDPVIPVAQREAQGVVRLLGGEVDATSSLRMDDAGGRPALAKSIKRARLWHVAAPVYTQADHPGFSYVDLGDEPLPFGWLVGESHGLKTVVLPNCLPERPQAPALGRVVGLVGPEGARPLKSPPPVARARPAYIEFARFLLETGIERVVLNTQSSEEVNPSIVNSAFYAGLARGDSPAEALFLAQRGAWNEGLHPVLWSGFSCWGWP